MKPNLILFLLTSCLVSRLPAHAIDLPDSCGSEQVKFNVKTQTSSATPPGPAENKAQIVLMENENHMVAPFSNATVRFGMDGAWTGADNGSSYFVMDVAPGLHHLCASWQSSLKMLAKNVDVTSFTAEAGKTYYFSAAVEVDSNEVVNFALTALNEDQGKYRLKSTKRSTFKSGSPYAKIGGCPTSRPRCGLQPGFDSCPFRANTPITPQ